MTAKNSKPIFHLTLAMMLTLGAISGLTPLSMDMYLPAMPIMATDLATSINSIQFTLTIYMAGFAIGQIIHGPLSDSYGRKSVLMIGIALFGISSLTSVFVDSVFALTLSRLCQGLSGATGAVVLMALIRDMFNREAFSRVMSLVSLIMTIAPLVAPLIGGYLTVSFGWRSIFILLASLSVVMILLIAKQLPETLPVEKRQPLRFRSIFLNYIQVLRNKKSLGLIACDSLAFTGMFSFLTVGSFVYIDIFGVKVEHFGYLFGLNVITMTLLTMVNARWVVSIGVHSLLRAGLALIVLASIGLVNVWYFDLGIVGLVPCIMVYVGSIGLINSNCMALLLNNYSSLAGTASALAGTMRFGMSAILGSIVAGSPHNPTFTLVLSMALCALGATCAYVYTARNA
ncbi:bicyclomycin resistance protein [Vibrio halioticoli NBRC 102217]|uniref:Bcr/CflA family efflux transporter n=1 Tax=Vibrio halioticoli NBRC 102217 TaxID=1219072 RepID=V5HNS3_9VIBR|nr:Bcr/CflA family multidrug efflux MFS transporter [Vibrio halioticoli]GAD90865.1 bicyclomycin resistance protein [Vibrio halioticoli NBRC 102217]